MNQTLIFTGRSANKPVKRDHWYSGPVSLATGH